MRKNQLIEMLQNIKGNPEIVVWNGLVEDYQPLKNELVSVKLFKLTFNAYKERVNLERKYRDNLPPMPDDKIKELYDRTKSHEWELFSYYPPDENDKSYKQKTVFLLEPKITGKTVLVEMVMFSIDYLILIQTIN